jgi:acetyl-CoA acetyltransferase
MSERRGVVIVDGVRTPFCRSWGALEDVPADDLSRLTMAEAMARVDLDPAEVDEVVVGNIAQPADTTTLARVSIAIAAPGSMRSCRPITASNRVWPTS